MNNFESYSNKDGVSSATWPDPVRTMGDNPYYPYPSVPQSSHHDFASAPGCSSTTGSYVPCANAADDAAPSFPTTETGAFADLLTQLDYANQVLSNRCVGM